MKREKSKAGGYCYSLGADLIFSFRAPMAEVANVAWKRVAFFDEPKSEALRVLGLSREFILGVCRAIPSQELLEEAFEIATENRIPIYDSLFVAASEKMNAPLFSTDRKLYERIRERDDVVLV
ncbi:type II toxin-antitoxin system VapC family toxin [Methanocrinis sp.]|uniref:type II toxin-antitoxin system VapC family toxin n=1 Tax=Methanocrinis sp. TaxID=3101522 RepID=UPI003D1054D3